MLQMLDKQDDIIAAAISEQTSTVIQKTRCYMEPVAGWTKKPPYKKRDNKDAEWKEIEKRAWPHSGFTLTFDTETFSFEHGQRARYGVYQLRGVTGEERRKLHRKLKDDEAFREALDAPFELGVFHNSAPGFVSDEELAVLRRYVDDWNTEAEAGRKIDPVTGMPFPRLKLLTQEQFIRNMLYRYSKQLGDDLLIIGLNLAYDLGAISKHAGLARGKKWFGAFKMRLNDYNPKGNKATARDYFYPAIYYKPLGMKRSKFGWAAEDQGIKNSKKKVKTLKSHFLDVSQLGSALLGPGHSSMETLSAVLKTPTQKGDFEDYDGPITSEALKYCFDDAEVTFEIWTKLRERYRTLGISKPVWNVFSPASLGKGFYDDMGVPHFMEAHPDFPPSVLGICMVSFYGGRSEVRIRMKPVEVIHTDFKSQYSTCNALLGTHFLLAETYEIRCGQAPHFVHHILRCAKDQELRTPEQLRRIKAQAAYWARTRQTESLHQTLEQKFGDTTASSAVQIADVWEELARLAEEALCRCEAEPNEHLVAVRTFLEKLSPDILQRPETIRHLLMKTLVLVNPADCILPFHADYGGASSNIGDNACGKGLLVWWTILDAVSAKLKTGKTPEIFDAITIVPIRRVKTTPKSGINLETEEFATAIINRRIAIEQEMADLPEGPDRDVRDAHQLGLKVIASSTAFGIHAEINVDERTGDYSSKDEDHDNDEVLAIEGDDTGTTKSARKRNKRKGFEVDLYAGGPTPTRMRVAHLEEPGEHFAPHLATFITAAGRLLLTICERLAADRGLTYAFCDTDSMAFARPDGMERDEFRKRVHEIVTWFAPLWPYTPDKDKDGTALSILQYEKANWRPVGEKGKCEKGEYEPLYFLGLASKRYVLYHRVPFAEVLEIASEAERAHCSAFIRDCLKGQEPEYYPLFRKISAHGTGGLGQPGDYEHSMPKPADELAWRVRSKRGKLKGKLLASNALCEEMLRDVWRKFVLATENGKKLVLTGEAFDQPIISSISLRSKGYWEDFADLPDKRPAMFFSTMPKPIIAVQNRSSAYGEMIERADVLTYGPKARTFADLEPQLRSAKDHTPYSLASINAELARLDREVGTGAHSYIRFRTFRDFFTGTGFLEGRKRGYFEKQEHTSDKPDGTGLLKRKSLIIAARVSIGKEGNELRDDLASEASGVKAGLDTQTFEDSTDFNAEILDNIDLQELAARTKIAANHLSEYRSGSKKPPHKTITRIVRAIQDIQNGVPLKDEKLDLRKRQDQLRAAIQALSEHRDPVSIAQHCKAIEWGKETGLDLRRKSSGLARIIARLAASSKQPKEIAARLTQFMRGAELEEREEKAIADALEREHKLARASNKTEHLREILSDQRLPLTSE
jgi:transcriptional regulator with XRE-family HTH domain